MNKYEETFHIYEGKFREISKIKNRLLCVKYYRFILEKLGKKECLKIYNTYKFDIILKEICCFNELDELLQKWLLENAIPEINKESLISHFLEFLNDSVVYNNTELRKTLMSSMKLIGLVKDIIYEENNIFILTTNNNERIKFIKSSKTVEDIEKNRNRCHNIAYDSIVCESNLKVINKCTVVTILEKDIYNSTRYHSFIIYDGVINDFARNIIIKIEDYKKLFKPEFILNIPAEDFITDIKIVESKDKEFKEANLCKVLKYSIHKQMNA